MNSNYLFTRVIINLIEEFGEENTFKTLYEIVNKISIKNKENYINNEQLYKKWYSELPTGFKLHKLKKEFEYYYVNDLPRKENELLRYLISYKEENGVRFYTELLKTKTQRRTNIKKWFTGKNAIGLPTHSFDVEVSGEWDCYEETRYVSWVKDGLFYLNYNKVIDWDTVDKAYINALSKLDDKWIDENETEDDVLIDTFFKELY